MTPPKSKKPSSHQETKALPACYHSRSRPWTRTRYTLSNGGLPRLCLQCFPRIRQSCSEASSRRFLSVLHRPTALYAIRRRYCSSSKHLSCMLFRLSQNLRNSKHFFRKIAFANHITFPTVAPYTAKSFSPSRPSAAFRGPSSKAPTAQTPIRCVYAAK